MAQAEEELEVRREVERLRAQQQGVLDSGNSGQPAGSTPTQPPPSRTSQQTAPPRGKQLRQRDLTVWFDGKVESLPYFLVQVEEHMQRYSESYSDDIEQIHKVRALLEGEAAAWYVGLYEGWMPELMAFPRFMSALCRRFEGPFQEERAKRKLQNLRQGMRLVADFTSEFCQLAGQIRDWPEPVLVHFYKEALDPEIAQWGTMGADPPTLAGWYRRAGETEICLIKAQSYQCQSSPRRRSPPAPARWGGTSVKPHPIAEWDLGSEESQMLVKSAMEPEKN
uniref:Uncharacterized protein n=1 Tax=Sphaerodactylus townsendi TaxID=933632 RepID=A0ACB8FT61_9SAUR